MAGALPALDAFGQATADMKRQRQDFAKAKAERLRKELDYLRLHGGVNPKGTARRATQIGHELVSAARGYAAQRLDDGGRDGAENLDLTEALSRTADGFLRQEDGIGADARFADTLRRLFMQARREVRQRRCTAEEQGIADSEYDVLERRVRRTGPTLEQGAADCASPRPLDLEV